MALPGRIRPGFVCAGLAGAGFSCDDHAMRSVMTIVGWAMVLGLVFGCAPKPVWRSSVPPHEGQLFWLGGIQVDEPDQAVWVSTLKAVGFNTVATTVYALQGDWDSEDLRYAPQEPSVVEQIRAAKRAGLEVVLVLRVALDPSFERNRFLWHGMIQPRTDAQLEAWFQRYDGFVDQWAKIAEAEGVDLFAIGSELNGLAATTPTDGIANLEAFYLDDKQHKLRIERLKTYRDRITRRHLETQGAREEEGLEGFLRTRWVVQRAWAKQVTYEGDLRAMNARRRRLQAHWEAIIQTARRGYKGRLSYAANFDQYTTVGFWDRLDVMGINAYFPLRQRPGDVTVSSLRKSWRWVLSDIDSFRDESNISDMPVVFTELGYTRRENSTLYSWAANGFEIFSAGKREEIFTIWEDQPVDLEERAHALEALHTESQRHPGLLQGILYWKLSTQTSHLEKEPFALVVGPHRNDPLQAALQLWSMHRTNP